MTFVTTLNTIKRFIATVNCLKKKWNPKKQTVAICSLKLYFCKNLLQHNSQLNFFFFGCEAICSFKLSFWVHVHHLHHKIHTWKAFCWFIIFLETTLKKKSFFTKTHIWNFYWNWNLTRIPFFMNSQFVKMFDSTETKFDFLGLGWNLQCAWTTWIISLS